MQESLQVKTEFMSAAPQIVAAAEVIIQSLKSGGKLLICGNGGSAADAQHIAAELVGRYETERRGLPAIALSTDTSILTAWANDYSYETVFSRQVESLGDAKDVLLSISTSGNSKNILAAAKAAKSKKMKVVSLTGKDGGQLKGLSDININVTSSKTARIQECHMISYHIICEMIDLAFSE